MEHAMGRKRIGTCLAALLLLLAAPVHALQISGLTPQGEVARVRQVVVKFDQAAVRLGDAQAPAPVAISCDDPQAAKGSGRWATERSWTFDFAQDLPPGVRCAVQANADLRSPTGAALAGQTRFSFSSGGPFVQNTVPYAGSRIDEEQHFILRLNGPATPESIQAHVWCGMRGLGERIAVRLVEGADRAAMLALPPVPPLVGWRKQVRLGRDYYVNIARNDYSVDPTWIGRMVDAHADLEKVQVRLGGRLVAEHPRVWARGLTITDTAHVATAARLRQEFQQTPTRAGTDGLVRDLADYDKAFGLNTPEVS